MIGKANFRRREVLGFYTALADLKKKGYLNSERRVDQLRAGFQLLRSEEGRNVVGHGTATSPPGRSSSEQDEWESAPSRLGQGQLCDELRHDAVARMRSSRSGRNITRGGPVPDVLTLAGSAQGVVRGTGVFRPTSVFRLRS